MADPNRDTSDSLLPIEMEASIDAEMAALNRGKSARGVLMAVLVVAAAAGGVVIMRGLDADRAFADAADAVEALETEHLAAFENCVLTGKNRQLVQGELDLVAELDRRSSRMGAGYARRLRQCLRHLDRFEAALDKVTAPDALHGELEALGAAAEAQGKSYRTHLDYLEDPDLDYTSAAARPALEKIAADWRALHEAHTALSTEAGRGH